MDRALTWFISLWVGFALFLMIVDIFWILTHAPSLWSGILAAQEQWFDPFNFRHIISEAIFLSPAVGALFWRQKRRSREQSSLTSGLGSKAGHERAQAAARVTAKTIILRVIVITLSLAAVVLIAGTLLMSALRDRMFSFNMEKLDGWVKNGGTVSTAQTEVYETCSNLVLSQAGALERLELLFILRDELISVLMSARR